MYLTEWDDYVKGVLPDWSGRYPGAKGGHITGAKDEDKFGFFLDQRTAHPSGGFPKMSSSIPDGGERKFNHSGGTYAFSNSWGQVTIDSGWDSVTRPPTVAVSFIIKHD